LHLSSHPITNNKKSPLNRNRLKRLENFSLVNCVAFQARTAASSDRFVK
tara:strand:- start:974 stop:1120 length:147 start_codon:yes stop_codon:yes gene_type:complete